MCLGGTLAGHRLVSRWSGVGSHARQAIALSLQCLDSLPRLKEVGDGSNVEAGDEGDERVFPAGPELTLSTNLPLDPIEVIEKALRVMVL